MKKGSLVTLLLTTILLSSNLIISEEDSDLGNFNGEIDEIKTIEKNTQYPKIQSQLLSLINSNFKTNSNTFNQFSSDLVNDRIRVEVSLKHEQAIIQLEDFSNNITVENHYKSLAQILIPLDLLKELSQEDYVNFIRPPVKPRFHDVTSEGVAVIGADDVQNEGYNGTGVKVAIVDGGFQGYDSNPELPSARIKEIKSFRADGDIEAGIKHGSACAEIVLDVAPNTDIYLYNFGTISELNDAVTYAISADIDVISFSCGYIGINDYDGIGYPEMGDVCSIVDNARSSGVLFIVSSGNEADHHYEGIYDDYISGDSNFHDFGDGNIFLELGYYSAGYPYDIRLSWDEWPVTNQDYDLILWASTHEAIVDYSMLPQTGSQPPVEAMIDYTPYSDFYYIVISKYDASRNVHLELYGSDYNEFLEFNHPESSLCCPADAVGSTTIGATYHGDDNIEDFSSQGPTNDGRTKPDLTAPDGVSTHAYSPDEFYGTSASAPHTAGAAALVLSFAPDLTVDELESKLETTAFDLGSDGKDNVYGSGRIDVWTAYNFIVPSVNFSYSPSNPTTTSSVQFSDSSLDTDGFLLSWKWDFGDGNTSTEQNPTHQYLVGNRYNVTLNVTDDDGAKDEITKQLIVNALPNASFTYSPTNPTTNDTISFMDNSSDSYGEIIGWNWSFGDGNTSTEQNPTHQYSDNGTYRVSFNVTDVYGASNETNESIIVLNVEPIADFSYFPTNPTDFQIVTFTDNSSDYDGTIVNWTWDFGNGNISYLQNPSHNFSDNGSYTVSLNITDDDGATNETNESIIVLNVEPIADFSYLPKNPTDLQTVVFTDASTDYDGTIVNWTWDFGNGNISYLQNPSHTFSDNGTYTITLNVTDDDGAKNETTEQISIFNVAPESNFTFNPLKPNVNHTIDFTDNSSDADGTVENWLWDFGDGNTSTIQHPTHYYTDNGTYIVNLTITDNDGDTNQSSTQLIVYWGPNANFTYEPLHPTFNEQINFTDSSIDYDGSIVNWTWNFGDGNCSYDQNPNHSYPQPGSYLVSLNVTDDSYLFGVVSNRIVVNVLPEANFTYSPSTPRTENTITFNDTSLDSYGEINNWTWDFGDGNRSYLQNTTHSYVDNGTYTVNLTVTDNCTATDLMTKQITVLNTPPYVDFTYNPEEPTDIEIITFNDTSTDSDGIIVNWTWDFGDGNISYLQNSSHTFSDNGTYTIALNVTDDDGATNETNLSILVNNIPPTIDFTYIPTNPVEDQLITFNGSGLDQDGTIENWTWNFNDGNLSYSQNTTHVFSVFNSHHVNLTVRDNDGNTSFVNKTIVMKNKIINQTNEHTMTSINLTDEFDLMLELNTTNTTNVNISKYSEIPSECNGSTVNSIGKYFEIIVENESAIIWPMNLSIFYTRDELNNASLNEQQLLGVFFWNETIERWDLYNNTGVNTTNQSGYDGYLWANIWHLTNMTAGGDYVNPDNVTGLSVTDAKNGKLDLSWNTTSDNIGVAYYRIYCDKKPTINISDNATNYQITGLTNDETYSFNVSAVDLAGNEGNQSDSKTGTPTSESSSTPPSSSPGFAPPPGPSNPEPIADAGGPYQGYVNDSMGFDGSGSSDDGSLVDFSWDFGDGSVGFGMNPSHIFDSVGNYSVVLTVTDDNDSIATNTTMAYIEAVPPVAPMADADGPYVCVIDQQIVLDGSGSRDSDGSIMNYTWMGGYNKTWYGENPKMSYPISGVFSIRLTVTDDDGLTDNDTTSVTVYVGESVDIPNGFVIDTDDDGTVDSFFNESSKTVTIMQETDGGTYLIDAGDGFYDKEYDPATGGVTPYSPSSKEDDGNFWLYIAIIIIAVIAFIIVILIKMGILVIE